MDNFLNFESLKFYDTISRFGIDKTIVQSGFVIAAYSGGADSSCLLRFLKKWCGEHKLTLAAAHVNHMIRGEDAVRDEEFCRTVCNQLGVPIFVLREDVPKLARESGRGLEETARAVRYDFFDKVSAEISGDPFRAAIATAHNADDNLETVIFNLLRGSGTHGMSGIDPLRGGRYVRPLICDNGDEIRKWCADNGVSYVTDATNTDTEYSRNFIRHNVVPMLEQICESPQKSALRLTSLIRRDDDYLEKTAAGYVRENDVSVPRRLLTELHPAISSRVIRILYDNAIRKKAAKASIEEIHIREILRIISSASAGASFSLPGFIRFTVNRRTVCFSDAEDLNIEENHGETAFIYPDDGDTFENERYIIRFSHTLHANTSQIDENIYKLFIYKTFCFDKIKGVLKIRYRRPADVYVYGGMTRKVKKLFIDKKLTAEEKSSLPLICDGDEIIWIPGFPPKDGISAGRGDAPEKCLRITCYYKKPEE